MDLLVFSKSVCFLHGRTIHFHLDSNLDWKIRLDLLKNWSDAIVGLDSRAYKMFKFNKKIDNNLTPFLFAVQQRELFWLAKEPEVLLEPRHWRLSSEDGQCVLPLRLRILGRVPQIGRHSLNRESRDTFHRQCQNCNEILTTKYKCDF